MLKILRPAFYITGIILIMLSGFMTLPALLALFSEINNYEAFLISSIITFGAGVLLTVSFRMKFVRLQTRQLFLVTVCSWFFVSIFSSLPFIFCTNHFSITDAVFESVSGLTTTGSTVLLHLDTLPKDILLWRSMLQWLGGIGIIGMAIAVLPFLHVGGMRLFKTESSDWSDKSHFRAKEATKTLFYTYILLSVICLFAYFVSGMTIFDAINHAMTTISTGGYSTHDTSFGYFDSELIQWIAVIFMILGSMPFLVHVQFLSNLKLKIYRDEQVVGYIVILTGIGLITALYLFILNKYNLGDSITYAFFNITSVLSTTGFASTDYGLWGGPINVLFFLITIMGGCSGSSSGGIKIFRFQLSYLLLKQQILKSIHPRAVITAYFNDHEIDDEVILSAVSFTYLFIITLAIITLLLALQGLDFITSFSGAATALSNCGPGLGGLIGPSGSFHSLPDMTKWILSAGMLSGRLELLTVAILFSGYFWKS